MASSRKVTPEIAREWVEQGPYTVGLAEQKGLLDGVLYQDGLEAQLKKDGLRSLPPFRLPPRDGLLRRVCTFYRPQIAYLVADGAIAAGESRRLRRPILGAETLIRLLRDVRRRKRIKAVVIRINSPGGSALASDLLRREIDLTNRKKPVIASFGDVAASGGYLIAMGARQILAQPSTLTGSIGIIAGKLNLQNLLAKVGVTVDRVSKAPRAGFGSPTRPYSPEETAAVTAQMQSFYEDLFL